MKVPRFITEYANYKKRLLLDLIKEYPTQESDYRCMIDNIEKAVWCYERGYVTVDECIQRITNSTVRV